MADFRDRPSLLLSTGVPFYVWYCPGTTPLLLCHDLLLQRINGVVVTWVVAIDPPGVRFPLNASIQADQCFSWTFLF